MADSHKAKPWKSRFRWTDYRAEGRDRQKVMTLATGVPRLMPPNH